MQNNPAKTFENGRHIGQRKETIFQWHRPCFYTDNRPNRHWPNIPQHIIQKYLLIKESCITLCISLPEFSQVRQNKICRQLATPSKWEAVQNKRLYQIYLVNTMCCRSAGSTRTTRFAWSARTSRSTRISRFTSKNRSTGTPWSPRSSRNTRKKRPSR